MKPSQPIFPKRYYQLTRPIQVTMLFLVISVLLSMLAGRCTAAQQFPNYPAIRASVAFWEKIYSTYSVNSAVIHDRDDLSKVYEVVQLLDNNLPGAPRINRAAVKQAVKKYQKILTSLGKGKTATTDSEKKIEALFHGPPARKRMAKAAQTIRSQTGQKERFIQGVIRSGAYLPEIKRIFITNGLPAELAYLPHVESSFNTKAYSKFGAAGIWQFTRATGKQYLQINEAVDERRDPLIAAYGAVQYLKNSYRELGSWPLALTAYNYGTAGMLRAKKAKGSYEKIYADYREGHFGFASQNFYSEFLAALQVAKRLEKDGTIKRDDPIHFATYVLPGYIHVKEVKRHFRISATTLKELNPALREPVYNGKKLLPRGYALRLPEKNSIRSLISTLPRSYLSGGQKKDALYTVQPGDTAGGIAVKYGIRLSKLIKANALDQNGKIYVGQQLHIPTLAGVASTTALRPYLEANENKRFSASKGLTIHRPPHIPQQPVLSGSKKHLPAVTPIAREGARRDVVIVRPEESLALYAHWLNIPEKKLRSVNNISQLDSIHPGQEVTVLYSKVPAAKFADFRTEFARGNEADFFAAYIIIEQKKYIVQQGDTLWDLCNNQFSIPLWLLKKYNDDLDYARIHAAQELIVPVVREL